MFRTTHIRTKLAVALAVPLAALVAVAGFEVVVAKADVDDTRSQTALATSSLGPGSLVTRLQDERNRISLDMVGLDTELPVDSNEEARELVDAAVTEFRADVARRGGDVEAAFRPSFEAFADLEALRADIDAFDGPMDLTNDEFADEVFTRYTDIVETFFDATSRVALAVDGAELRNGAEIIDAATRQSEMRARIVRELVLGVLTGTADEPAVGQQVAALLDRSRGFDADIRSNATGPYAGVGDATFGEAAVQSFVEQVEAFLADGTVDINAILESVRSAPGTGYLGLRDRAAGLLTAQARSIEGDALDRQQLFVAIAAATLILAILVTWLASRSITRPLRSLQTQAHEMASTTLPAAVRQILDTPPGDDVVIPEIEPIKVKTRDEVREVAAALSSVQTSAVDLAVEQAVLRRNISDSYINLGRRNQNLLSRQLDFITDLERNESDPDALEGLFKLDHLATRMRRNAESLLVLAGIEPPRQWAAPVKVTDVVRAALGEVEDYKRVLVRHLEPAAVTGAVASDIAHVLAELIENGLSFSPPDQTVEIKGRLSTSGYTLAINDNGMGMSPEELERSNRRLAGEESFTVAPSRYLGHYVAGHLASRLGITVELHASPAGGTTARVDIPMRLVVDDETDPAARPVTPTAQVAGPVPAPAPPAPAAPAPVHAASDVRDVPAPSGPATTPNGLPRRGAAGVPSAAASDPAGAQPITAEPLVARHAATEPGVTAEPATDVEHTAAQVAGRGFGGLAMSRPSHGSMYSAAVRAAREANGTAGEPLPAPPGTSSSGLPRRVPGAQRPDAAVGRTPQPEPALSDEPLRSSPEDVYSFLSSFQSGVAKGRADAHGEPGNEPEDGDR